LGADNEPVLRQQGAEFVDAAHRHTTPVPLHERHVSGAVVVLPHVPDVCM
jgi:hypothetical protein